MEKTEMTLADAGPGKTGKPAVIRAENLTKVFRTKTQPVTALHGLSLSVMEGEIFGIIGTNGSGKSTFLRILATLLAPTDGTALVRGHDIGKSPEEVRACIGFCPQNFTCDPELSAYDNLEFYGRVQGIPDRILKSRIQELLSIIGIAGRADVPVKALSGGTRRKVEIVRAFIHRPPVLFLDEPTLGLDPEARMEIWQQIRELNAGGTTIVFTTQIMEEAERICDRIAFFDHGTMVALGSLVDLKGLLPEGDLIRIGVESWDDRAEERLREIRLVHEVFVAGHTITISAGNGNRLIQDILDVFEGYAIPIRSISIRSPCLEDIFIHLTLREAQGCKRTGAAKAGVPECSPQ